MTMIGELVQTAAEGSNVAFQITQAVFEMPFDLARAGYANAVRLGLVKRSMLGGRQFERCVRSAELVTLGPLARHV